MAGRIAPATNRAGYPRRPSSRSAADDMVAVRFMIMRIHDFCRRTRVLELFDPQLSDIVRDTIYNSSTGRLKMFELA